MSTIVADPTMVIVLAGYVIVEVIVEPGRVVVPSGKEMAVAGWVMVVLDVEAGIVIVDAGMVVTDPEIVSVMNTDVPGSVVPGRVRVGPPMVVIIVDPGSVNVTPGSVTVDPGSVTVEPDSVTVDPGRVAVTVWTIVWVTV